VLYTASNAKLKINDTEICATNAQLSLNTSIQPNYLINQRSTNEYAASNGIGGQLNFNYYLTGADYFATFITGQGEVPIAESQVISGNFGGLHFDSGYLTTYSINFSPNAPAIASANVVFFDQLNGVFESTEEQAPEGRKVLNFKHADVYGELASGEVENFIGGAYNYSCDVKPVYLMSETKPSRVSFGEKTVSMNFEIDNPTGYLPVSGTNAKILVHLQNQDTNVTENTFPCSGLIQQRSLASAAGDYIKQSINIVQASTDQTIISAEAFIDDVYSTGKVEIGSLY
jgi:hypothetical protein